MKFTEASTFKQLTIIIKINLTLIYKKRNALAKEKHSGNISSSLNVSFD